MDTIGAMLAEERKKKGLDYIDVEHATGIRALYIKALEEGHYEVLPGDVYVRGFIRNYGNFLGLDGPGLVHLYSEAVTPHEKKSVVEHKPVRPVAKSTGKKNIFSILAVVLTLAVAGGILYSWQKGAPSSVPAEKPNPVAQTQKPATPVLPAVQSGVSGIPFTGSSAKAVVLVARFTDRCWTSAIADGKTVYEGIPKTGETLTWEADRQIIVNLGNAAAVDISFNGQPQGKIGERGDVVVKTFAAPGISPVAPSPNPVAPSPGSVKPSVRP